mgnify:FL=1
MARGEGVQVIATLRLGSQGPAVVALQRALATAGYYLTDDIDGDFGPVTEAAVETYQLAHSLDVDGVAGPVTLAELGLAAASTPAPPTLPTGADPHAIPRPPAGWIVGVDTSAAQGILDVPALQAAGVAFLIAKATDGERSVDARWTITAAAARRHGLPLGAYGVYEPAGVAAATTDAARAARVRAQALHFVEVVRDAGLTLPPVLDFELARGPALHNLTAAARWVDVVADALGREPMLYTGPAFFRDLCRMAGVAAAPALERLARCPVWLAHYGPALSTGPSVPEPWASGPGWAMWQASGDAPRGAQKPRPWAHLPGRPSVAVDVDYFRGPVDALVALGRAAAVVGSPP